MAIVFFSYSHRDEALRDELEIHLALLRREELIQSWHDRRIDAGDELDGSIDKNLETADIILLLVSPYFIASNYCFDVEMRRAIERHNAGNARVIPVILNPCDWHSSPFAKLMAVPKDGKPITKFPNIHDGFLEVVQAIRAIVQPSGKSPPTKHPAPPLQAAVTGKSPEIRSSNLRVKKTFTDHDHDRFLEESFEYIAKFFEGSLEELQRRNPEITTRFRRIDANRFAAFVYRDGKCVSECSIRLGGLFGKGIAYASDAASTNSMNDQANVCDDGTTLYLKSSGISSFGGGRESALTQEGAAESFWEQLIRPVQQR